MKSFYGAIAPPTVEDVGLTLLTKDGPYFSKVNKNLHGYTKGSDIAPPLTSYGSTYQKQFDFSYLNPSNSTYEVLRVEKYLASGGYAHVFMVSFHKNKRNKKRNTLFLIHPLTPHVTQHYSCFSSVY